MTLNDLTKLLSASVRPISCFTLIGAFVYTVIAGLPIEATAAVAGPTGLVIGYYFRERARITS